MENAQPIFDNKFFTPEEAIHNGKNIIWIRFPKDYTLIKMLKSAAKARWSNTQKSWYVTDNSANRERFGLDKKIVGKEVLLKIHPNNLAPFQTYQNQLLLKGFSQNTIRVYSLEFAQLLYTLRSFPVHELTREKLKSYFLYCHQELKLSENQIHSRMNAVKFYFEKVLHQDKIFFDIPRPKKPQLLPKALNTTEILKLLNVTENPKHKLILQLCYGMGLRVSEIVNIKIEDIDSKTMKVLIAQGKGKKDRYVNLPHSILADLRLYYKAYLPKIYLFEGQSGGKFAIRSAQSVFKVGMNKAGIKKTVGIHSLRHSYATHLMELGTDISLIQKLLGHNDIKTTLNYTHVADRTVASVPSPLDKLFPR